MSALTTTESKGLSETKKPRKASKEETTGLIQQTFKSGYESTLSIAMGDAYAAGVVLGVQERIAPLVSKAIASTGTASGAFDSAFLDEAIASLPTSTSDCDWWETA